MLWTHLWNERKLRVLCWWCPFSWIELFLSDPITLFCIWLRLPGHEHSFLKYRNFCIEIRFDEICGKLIMLFAYFLIYSFLRSAFDYLVIRVSLHTGTSYIFHCFEVSRNWLIHFFNSFPSPFSTQCNDSMEFGYEYLNSNYNLPSFDPTRHFECNAPFRIN